MSRQPVSTLITDFDDTLYSWINVWYHPFNAMITRLAELSRVPETQLIEEVRAIHQRHGTSEYAFLIEEIPSLRAKHPGENLAVRYQDAIQVYRAARDEALVLFPGVIETLDAVKSRGSLIVAYTETMGYYSNFRLKRLGLDGIIDIVYSPEDHELPTHLTNEQLQCYTAHREQLEKTIERHTPKGERKPNPQVLLDIMRQVEATKERTIYVGDKPFKDIAMARQAGVVSVLAKYGDAVESDAYELLKAVTHWSEEDVEREARERREFFEKRIGQPVVELTHSYAELLDHFDFISHESGKGE